MLLPQERSEGDMGHAEVAAPSGGMKWGEKRTPHGLAGSEQDLVCGLPCLSWGLSMCAIGDSAQSSDLQGTVAHSTGWHNLTQ